ncbi:hypothetical protein HETIRDRAFT_451809 [Heterobasidion irregulare TC 32-1]|uniref:Glycoside hydrolase 131 catalytic N-terminal domain-containing protein n=1 Tax=Heterobasidion irregulare (strain TC 32-1) TaxID=747525 RepID=W4K8T0_HETIT|nr:uncharacterized protein HETIRDRAFT_451809 [Heterobasidion irregulare TC 32-1]ETW82242.1 hypothetical protein HETIRDRAFT_451809 [Heterobasidion irregulare TC 32-1]
MYIPALAAVGTFVAAATSILYDGRAPSNLTAAQLDTSSGPYVTAVKGSQNASHYTTLLGQSVAPTPLWGVDEQSIRVTIDNTSVFTPGTAAPQLGFRRTELIAQGNPISNRTAFDETIETGVTAFHFSLQADPQRPLNLTHDYQVVFIEPSDGTHVFGLELGTPFNQTPDALSHSLKLLAHDSTVVFNTSFTDADWHNFAVVVDWTQRTLQVLYSANAQTLQTVTDVVPNTSATAGAAGQGEFHFGVLKLPLIDPTQTSAQQSDVVHFGIQEGTTEGLIYSGVFVESASSGVSVGNGRTVTL